MSAEWLFWENRKLQDELLRVMGDNNILLKEVNDLLMENRWLWSHIEEIREKESDRRGVEGEESLPYLPKELWMLVASHVHHNDMFAFVSTCTQFREIHKEMKPQRNLKSTALL